MRKLILAVLGCCLLITESVQYKFGDIISFKRKCPVLNRLTYKHFAIYVDNHPSIAQLDNKGNRDIFQRTGPILGIMPLKLSDCVFDYLSKEQKNSYNSVDGEKLDNYFDNKPGFNVGTDDQIAKRIKDRLHTCGNYWPFSNNCEHLATYVRYGESFSLQEGASSSSVCKSDKKKCEAFMEFAKELEESNKAQQECKEAQDKVAKSG